MRQIYGSVGLVSCSTVISTSGIAWDHVVYRLCYVVYNELRRGCRVFDCRTIYAQYPARIRVVSGERLDYNIVLALRLNVVWAQLSRTIRLKKTVNVEQQVCHLANCILTGSTPPVLFAFAKTASQCRVH